MLYDIFKYVICINSISIVLKYEFKHI